jgi:hypothetical protein
MEEQAREKLITEAVAEFEAGLRAKAEEFQTTHAERKLTISVIERLWGETRKLSDEILSRVYTELSGASESKELIQEKKTLEESGVNVRNKGKQERQIQTTQGVLTIRRSVLPVARLESEEAGLRHAEIIPLDEYLRISGLPFKMSPEMMAETAFFGARESSFKAAERMLRKCVPTQITDDLIREVTEHVGRRVFEADTRRACPGDKNLDKIPDKPDKKGILYIMIDGSAINTRIKDAKGSTWRENKLGLVFNSTDLRTRRDGVTHDIQRKEYVSYVGSVEQFKDYLLECAVRNGYGRYEQTIIVSDGAAWIRAMGEELFPDAADAEHPTDTGFLSSGGKHL